MDHDLNQTACPGGELLESFSIGNVDDTTLHDLEEHLGRCERCRERLQSLDTHADRLLDELRGLPVRGGDSTLLYQPAPEGPLRELTASVLAAWKEGRGKGPLDAGRRYARQLADGPVRLGRFELQAELGQGTFGYVFRARDPQLDRTVAIKVQRAGRFASDEDAERFLREARSAAQLKHPAVVSLFETGQTEDGVCYLVSEFIEGTTLEERLAGGPVSSADAATWATQLADALQYAHEHGIIHRDVKPSNILIDESGRAHLMDFGLAKRETGDATVTSDGRVMGTPAYMSPEQARGTSHDVDPRSDLYSLGVVLYEMLTGERPFHGNRRMLLLQVLEDEPRPPRQLADAVPRDLEVICLKAMSKLPARRYASAGELVGDLRRYQEGRPILARPVGYVERGLRWCRRYPLAVGVLVAVLFGSASGMLHLLNLSEYFVTQTALESARLETKILDETWRYYSDVVGDLDGKLTHVRLTEHYANDPQGMPLPATLAIELGDRISGKTPGMEVRVYSRYPWPDRKDGGPQDEYEREALDWLERNAHPTDFPPAEHSRFVTRENRRMLLYFTARHMEQSCLGCHNDPKGRSPKKDWQVGDVVGVLKIQRPLDREIENTRRGLRGAVGIMVSTALLFLAVCGLLVAGARNRHNSAQHPG